VANGTASVRRRPRAAAIMAALLVLSSTITATTWAARSRATTAAGGAEALRDQGAPIVLASERADTDGQQMRSGAVTDATYSSNWSGLGGTGQGIEGVEGHWTVPSVDASAAPGDSSSWVGVDGLDTKDRDLIQTGTEQDTAGGYYAWWEILPDPAVRIVASHGQPAPVRPGDEMTAIVNETARSGLWSIYLQDVTRNWYFDTQSEYSGPGRSAEWIEEAPSVTAGRASLPDFRTVTFSGTAIYGRFGTGLRWYSTNLDAANEIVLRDAGNTRTLARPSAPSVASARGQRFSDLYVSPSGPPTSTRPTGIDPAD
jgi:hypothetical protein